MLKTRGVLVVVALALSACGGAETEIGERVDGEPTGVADNELVVTDAQPPASIEVVDSGELPDPAGPVELGSGEPVSDDSPIFGRQFDSIPAGRSVLTTTGIPVSLEFGEGWSVLENTAALTVLTDSDSSGGVRDVTFFRPTALSNPDDPTLGGPGRQFWSVEDIKGWVDRVPPGILATNAVETSVGGEAALRFDVRLAPEVTCSEDVYCVGFAFGRAEQYEDFDPNAEYRVWWVDGVDYEPLVIIVTARRDNQDFFDVASELLSSIRLGDAATHPIGADIVPWECGFTSFVARGPVALPVAGGLQFDLPTDALITQGGGVAQVGLRNEGNSVVMLSPVTDAEGNALANAEDLRTAIEVLGVQVGEATTTTLLGTEAQMFDVERGSAGFDAVLITETGGGPLGWKAPSLGRLWVVETERGLVVAAVHSGNSSRALELALEDANEILPSLVLIDNPCTQ